MLVLFMLLLPHYQCRTSRIFCLSHMSDASWEKVANCESLWQCVTCRLKRCVCVFFFFWLASKSRGNTPRREEKWMEYILCEHVRHLISGLNITRGRGMRAMDIDNGSARRTHHRQPNAGRSIWSGGFGCFFSSSYSLQCWHKCMSMPLGYCVTLMCRLYHLIHSTIKLLVATIASWPSVYRVFVCTVPRTYDDFDSISTAKTRMDIY